MQKRLVRKLDLEMLLSQTESHPTPRVDLEQYTIPSDVAATMLYIAAYSNNDITGKTVLDLGCGTGRLAIGAAFLGARQAVGVDVDKASVRMALKNSVRAGLREKLQWVAADINSIRGEFDTVLQNPPFGVQTRGADRDFLRMALKTGKKVYSLHKSLHDEKGFMKSLKACPGDVVPVAPSPFLKRFIEGNDGRIRGVYAMMMTIPHMFSFHTRTKHEFVADLYVMEGRGETATKCPQSCSANQKVY